MNSNWSCAQVDAALPWVLNNTAGEPDRAQVNAHVATCAACRRRLAEERQLLTAMQGSAPGAAADAAEAAGMAAWNRFAVTTGDHGSPRSSRWLKALLVAQAAAIAALAIAIVQLLARPPGTAPLYRTATTPAATSTNPGLQMRLALAPEVSAADLAALAQGLGATIVQEPSPQGVVTLALSPDAVEAVVLARLRATPGVRLAEPVQQPGRP